MSDQSLQSPLDELITQWHQAQQQALRWAEIEVDLRKKIFDQTFPQPVPGTNKAKINHGMALVGTYRINYTVNRDELVKCPQELIDKLIRYRPEVVATAWQKLTDNERKVFADAITEKPGTPALELKPQNKVRW